MTKNRAPPLPTPVDPLQAYKAKRSFAHTPEPSQGDGEAVTADGPLRFVVQKHWASSLHYDFRLELQGTMKSWAVPKGPSFDPAVKRMAVQVEDHPIAYAAFEGTIPAGQYGAGKVIVWDAGSWLPLGDPLHGLRDGNLKFELRGQKLHGRWVLVRMKGKGEKQVAWLLIKESDAWARPAADFSVVDELPDAVKARPAPRARLEVPKPASATAAATAAAAAATATAKGLQAALPEALAPQLATLAAHLPAAPEEWLCEIKFDGYRMLVRVEHGKARFMTRNGHDWTARLASLRQAVEDLKWPPGWYDGEIVVPDEQGVPDFGALQQAFEKGEKGVKAVKGKKDVADGIVLYLFDLPYFDGHDLRALPLEQRRALLESLLVPAQSDRVRLSEAFDAAQEGILAAVCKLGLEGIVAKRRNSGYQSGRSQDWIKLKCGLRQEFVIGGYTAPQGTRQGFGSLLLGVHDAQGRLHYAGNVGSGFTYQSLVALTGALSALARTTSPFTPPAAIEGRPHWVAPTLVAEVSFASWTRAAHIRHAVFRGLRRDKDAHAVMRDEVLPVSPDSAPVSRTPAPPRKAGKSTDMAQITNPQRVVDAATGTTKLDLARYCGAVASLMTKHLKGRPVSWLRAPDGVSGPLFFQKHADIEKLPGVKQLEPAAGSGHAPMLEVVNAQGLLSTAQWNVIEFHTCNALNASFERPDRMVFDLDPGENVSWSQVQEAAELVHAFLTQLGLPSFLKTSGGKGLHVVVPLRRLHDWDTVKGFSQAIVRHMALTIPQRFVAKSGPGNRVGKIFIDYLRNGSGATTVCAWSARARPGLGVSIPVAWRELPALRGGNHWTVKSVHARLEVGNAPWAHYARAARGLASAMATLEYQLPSR